MVAMLYKPRRTGGTFMIQTVEQTCRFNPAIQDYRMSQGIENLAALIDDPGDGRECFARNFVTRGMEQLFCDEVS